MRAPEIGFLHTRVTAHLIGKAVSNDPPSCENRDPIGQRKDDMHVVLDDDLCHAPAFDLLQKFDGGVGIMPTHACGRLVQQQQERLLNETHC